MCSFKQEWEKIIHIVENQSLLKALPKNKRNLQYREQECYLLLNKTSGEIEQFKLSKSLWAEFRNLDKHFNKRITKF